MTAPDPSPRISHVGPPTGESHLGDGSRLSISLFNGITLYAQRQRVEITNRKGLALIGYLALSPNCRDTRERIVGLLWSEADEAKARATLRQTLRELRVAFDQCGYGGFSTERVDIALDPSTITVDVAEAIESVAAGRPVDALLDTTRITEALFFGFEEVDPAFRMWLVVCRENLRRRLVRGIEDHLSGGAYHGLALRKLAEALIQLDPTHEGAYQTVMRSHADAGDLAGALSAYKKLWDLLDTEYDMEPGETTQELVSAIKSGSYQRSRPAELDVPPSVAAHDVGTARARDDEANRRPDPLYGLPPKLVLVVESFYSQGVHPEKRYIAIGFRYELISRLVRFREWALIDGEREPVGSQVYARLPHYRITANLFQEDDIVAVVLTLLAGDTGMVISSERYSLALPNFFATQHQILRGLATSLNVQISAERIARMSSAPDVSLDIFDRWLRAQLLIWAFRPEDHARATQMLESIIVEAPRFGSAYSGLAQLQNSWHIVVPGTLRTIAVHQRALSLARTAAELDPLDTRAQLCLAWAYAMHEQFELALPGFRQARALNEYDPWTTTSVALGLAYGGELAEARDFADQALRLAPNPMPLHWCYQSTIRFLCGDLKESINAAEHAGDAVNYFFGWRAAALAQAGRLQDARREGSRFLEVIRAAWAGPAAPRDDEIARWLLHCFPFRHPEQRDALRRGLEAAGIPARVA